MMLLKNILAAIFPKDKTEESNNNNPSKDANESYVCVNNLSDHLKRDIGLL